jgi:hypothetical protein
VIWLTVAAFGKDPCADAVEAAAWTDEVKRLYEEGEAERDSRTDSATSVLERDEARVKAVRKLDKKGRLCTIDDKWHAAWILTQADDIDTLERAYALAQETMEARHANGAWLVAFTFDLKRTSEGYRQSYGTQTRVNERNQRCLIEVEPDVTDQDRADYGTKPIADVYREVLDLNGYRDDPNTLDAVKRHGLYCGPLAISAKAQKRIAPPPE